MAPRIFLFSTIYRGTRKALFTAVPGRQIFMLFHPKISKQIKIWRSIATLEEETVAVSLHKRLKL